MYHQLLHHLLQGKAAELPGVGFLVPETIAARKDMANDLLHPPFLKINFQPQLEGSDWQVFSDAAFRIQAEIGRTNEAYVPGVGNFFIADGKLMFNQEPVAMEFAPPAPASRIVRVGEAHPMVVGDTDTTTEEMSSYYEALAQETTSNRWWIGALVLAALGIAGILVYYFALRPSGVFSGPLHF